MAYVVETGGGAGGQLASMITVWGERVLRYGLALVIAWIGLMKFTEYEADGIQTLVANSPLLGWAYHFLTVRQLSGALGAVEVGLALLIALRPWSAKASAIGSAMAALMFLTTLSFLFSTPGWEPSLGGFPALSAGVGQFLLKDVVLLGAALWSLGESVQSHTQDVGARRGDHIKRAAHSQVAISDAGRRVRLHSLRIRARLRGAPVKTAAR